jgi:ribonuclease PH
MQSSVASSRALIATAGLLAAIVVTATAVACGSDNTVVPKDPTFVANMTGAGEFVEVQGTGERGTFDHAQLDALLALAGAGIETLARAQRSALGT